MQADVRRLKGIMDRTAGEGGGQGPVFSEPTGAVGEPRGPAALLLLPLQDGLGWAWAAANGLPSLLILQGVLRLPESVYMSPACPVLP